VAQLDRALASKGRGQGFESLGPASRERREQTQANRQVPGGNVAVWISIAVHLLGGIAILVGFMTRWAAAVLLLLCLGTAFGVHLPAGDIDNMMNFYKNLVMAGGFLYVIAYGAGALSFDKATTA